MPKIDATICFYWREPAAKTTSEAAKDFANGVLSIDVVPGTILPLDLAALGGRRHETVKAIAVIARAPAIDLALAELDTHPEHRIDRDDGHRASECPRCEAFEKLAEAAR